MRVEKSDHRQRRLLRPRRQRPRGRSADRPDDLATIQLNELHPLPLARLTA
jgi:hypothetical protein